MYGAMEFYKKCREHQLNPILGLELKLEETTLLVYAKNYQGYQSLIKLSTLQNEEKLTLEKVKEYSNQLILIMPLYQKELYNNLKEKFASIYLGYQNRKEENDLLKITDQVVFCRKILYLTKKDAEVLTYLYRIRDNKTVSDEIEYNVEEKFSRRL